MNTLCVWGFRDPEGADAALTDVRALVLAGRVRIDDAALISWPPGRRTPDTRELGSITGSGRLWGGSWGMLLSLIFLTPHAGPAFGAAAGAVAGSLQEFGVVDDFLKRVRDDVTPGTSALFALSTRDSARQLCERLGTELVRSELSPEQAEYLRDALATR